MSDEPTPKRRGRPPGSKTGKNPLHNPRAPAYKCDVVSLNIGVELRSVLYERARKAGVTISDYVVELLAREAHSVTLPEILIARLRRNAPSCSASRYAEIIIVNALNQKGEF